MTKVGVFKRFSNGMVAAWYVAILGIGFIIPTARTTAASGVSYGGSSVSGLVEDTIALPGLSVSSTDPTIPLTLSINDGILSMTTTTGLVFNGSSTGSRISFEGSVADINAALATLQYRSIIAGTKTLDATISAVGEVYYPGNGHIYEVINNGGGISWDDANTAAQALTKNGASGYLATVTTQEENDYLLGKLTNDGWFGASDAGTEGDWKWVSGPEAGTSFWSGLGDGSPVSGLFSNWADGEPNDSGSDEDCAQFYSSGSGWNDLPCGGPYLDYYVVEYGAPGDLPTAPPSASFTVTISEPAAVTVPIGSCLDLIDVQSNGTDNRYDNLQLTTNVDCTGETLSPMFDQVDPDFGRIGFRGEFDGQNFTLSGVELNDNTTDSMGLFSATNDASFTDITFDGVIVGQDCVGGLVGSATDTDFVNVTSAADVTANYDAGGIVGCLYNENGSHEMSTSSASGTISAVYEVAGGLVGAAEAYGEGTLNFTDNTASATVSAVDWASGGIIGDYDSYDDAEVTISGNETAGINAPATDTVGGLIGNAEVDDASTLTIEENTVTGAVIGYEYVGGLIGDASNNSSGEDSFTIQNSHITIDVSSTDGDSVGGLVGNGDDLYIYRSSSSGTIVGADDEVGGLVGESSDNAILESYSSGSVQADDSFAGGLTGRNSETRITRSYSTADVSGDDRVGGLVGANGGYIVDSYARGDVTGTDAEIGGLAGRCGREITNSYATGVVTGPGDTGGLLGYSDGCDVIDSFWDTETTLQGSSDGDETGKLTAEMKLLDTFTDTDTEGLEDSWNFSTVWKITEDFNDGYPCLKWQSPSCTMTDDDDDGIDSEVEDNAPNGGDANDDGIADSEQPHVSSFENEVHGGYTTLVVDDSCDITSITAATEPDTKDAGYEYPAGLLDFTVDCGTPGFTTTVTQYYFELDTDEEFVVRKYNASNGSYQTIETASINPVDIGGEMAIEAIYEITDGGSLDQDGTENGVIVDPAGVALSAVGVPNTGLGGTWR